jgi:hypothetical protein
MKTAFANYSIVAIAAVAHIMPVVCLIVMATENTQSVTTALAAGALAVSTFFCGYLHGLNRSF